MKTIFRGRFLREALDRSRGGLTGKVHLRTDGLGYFHYPMSVSHHPPDDGD